MARWVREKEIKTLGWFMIVGASAYLTNALTFQNGVVSFICVVTFTVAGCKYLVIPRDVTRDPGKGN